MRILKLSMVMILAVSVMNATAQSVDEIVKKHIDAIGGKDAISKVKSISIEGEVAVMGQAFPTVTTIDVGKGYKNVTTVNGMEIIQCFTPGGGWSVNPLMGASAPAPVSEDERKVGASRFDIGGPLYNYKEKGNQLEVVASDTVNGIKTIRLKLHDSTGIETLISLDPTTYYILKMESKGMLNGQELTAVSTFSDYKKTDVGYVMAYTTNTSSQGFDVTITHQKIEFNKPVDPKIFEMPKS
jgi:hypothetical protein